MNFLEMCQAVFIEGGISGQIGNVQNQTGEAGRVVNWVRNAYREVLNDQAAQWKFLRKTQTVQLTPGKQNYTFADLGLTTGVQFDTRSMRVALNADLSDEQRLSHMDFKSFREYWLFASRRLIQGRPLNASVNDNTEVVFGPIPDQAYYVDMQFQIMPAVLANNNDVPLVPDRFSYAIVWRALRHYGIYEAAPEVVARADLGYKEVMQQLEVDQAPEVEIAGPLC